MLTQKTSLCLESLWNEDVENRLTVLPILDVVAKSYYIRSSYLTCNTESELKFNLSALPKEKKYSVLYFAFHGKVGEIKLADGTAVGLPYLAHIMGKSFKNWVVHFGSCSTVGADYDTLEWFVRETGITAVMGYTKPVGWIDAAALDMIVLSSLQDYKDLSAMIK
jgi:hypothetical protein